LLTLYHFRYESHYGIPLGRKKSKKDAEPSEDDELAKKKSSHLQRKLEERRKDGKAKVDPHVEEQFLSGRLLGKGRHWLVLEVMRLHKHGVFRLSLCVCLIGKFLHM